MTGPEPSDSRDRPGPEARQVGKKLRRDAVARLLGGGSPVAAEAVERFIRQAPNLGIDLGFMAAVIESGPGEAAQIRQVCLPVVGEGRTVMLFVSGGGDEGARADEHRSDRVKAIHRAIGLVHAWHGEGVHLAQGLIEPRETWAAETYQAAGMHRLAELLYLSRPMRLGEARAGILAPGRIAAPEGDEWPGEVSVRPMASGSADESALRRALSASYEQTSDCPELAGMRTMEDIVAAHRAVGEFDPGLWWLVERAGAAEGCVLLNRCASQGCVELVYIGLSPVVRGLGLGQLLMRSAIGACAGLEREMRCAVDARNDPARRMYARLGFRESGRRLAFVALVEDLLARNTPMD